MAHVDALVDKKVAMTLEAKHGELRKKIASQQAEIEKLREHNKCFEETI